MLQQCTSSNQWSAFCKYSWSCRDAMVACRQLGFNVISQWNYMKPCNDYRLLKQINFFPWFHSGSDPTSLTDDYFGQWDKKVVAYYGCSGSENSIQDCYKRTSSYYYDICNRDDYKYETVGLACHSPPSGGEALGVLVFFHLICSCM